MLHHLRTGSLRHSFSFLPQKAAKILYSPTHPAGDGTDEDAEGTKSFRTGPQQLNYKTSYMMTDQFTVSKVRLPAEDIIMHGRLSQPTTARANSIPVGEILLKLGRRIKPHAEGPWSHVL